jgi:threonine/homoserine/homoserine lactone efflux protein
MIRSTVTVDARPVAGTAYDARTVFRDVFLVNALNPKGIVFYSAFMPQFVDPGQPLLGQFLMLSVTFLGLALVNVAGYCLLAATTHQRFASRGMRKAFHLTGGFSLICAGLYSATMEKR